MPLHKRTKEFPILEGGDCEGLELLGAVGAITRCGGGLRIPGGQRSLKESKDQRTNCPDPLASSDQFRKSKFFAIGLYKTA